MSLKVAPLTGAAVGDVLADVARLRIEVFREWPYLYDGDLGYETRYLADFARSEAAIVVGAWDGDDLIGAATGAPLVDHADDFAKAFAASDLAIEDIFYCAESVLLPAYRRRGVGHAFFDHREAWARACGFRHVAFCSVIRPDDHASRPADYRPLDSFWSRRGYAKRRGVIARLCWKDVGESHATEKALQFWGRTFTDGGIA